ncbi:hypothetical protein BDM02DRAFT_3110284 [Thelephora ganbajun]|uniref:Uncharacterized protein n=1 Tax=Thelephora ganbajun TaxID=370292 RepID=A0ACB6ZQZ5_THEGA|nr:hypothetical protein BDM02DRAFT_3110284 [Thelephora ganbajun]
MLLLPFLLSLSVSVPAQAAFSLEVKGVHPSLYQKYVPTSSNLWSCLDESRSIPWSSVNDDYCDCPDGSDEPGTGACKNSTFFCVNVGHVGALISATRVNDGLCEPQCCDGSDEPTGICPNICDQVGIHHRALLEQETKLRKTGSKIRASYISFAQKEKMRLEAVVTSAEREVTAQTNELARIKEIVDRTESLSAVALERRKSSPLFKSLESHSELLESLLILHKNQRQRLNALEDILSGLRTGYNPNYQDMAVLEAVRGWEQIAGLHHINDVQKGEDEGGGEPLPSDGQSKISDEIERKVESVLKADRVSLLMEHEKYVDQTQASPNLLNLSYIPQSFAPAFDYIRSFASAILGYNPLSSDAASVSRVRQLLSDAEAVLREAEDKLRNVQRDLEDLFKPDRFGKDGEWKKLDGLCLEKDTGEYTYEVCLFGEAKQKGNSDGSVHSLGHFSSWKRDEEVGTPDYYSRQMFTGGAKCWNGPQRSIQVDLSCGLDNELLTITEPEKCEYLITGTTPALCTPLESWENVKDEL